jgi:ribosome-binding factor A
MAREFSRTRRVGASIKRELAGLLQSRVRDAGLGLVTITAVEVTPDYQWATVYITVLGDATQWEALALRLDEWSGELRHELAQSLALRSMPRLRFAHDETIARAARIGELLVSVRAGESQAKPERDD